MFAFFIVGTIAATILTEKEEGTFRRLLASPIHRGSTIAGKMLAYMLVVGLQVLVVFGVGSGFFGVPLGNSPLGLLLVTLALALTATSLGMLVLFCRFSGGPPLRLALLLLDRSPLKFDHSPRNRCPLPYILLSYRTQSDADKR